MGQFLALPAVEARPELVLPLLPLATESLAMEPASKLIKLAHEAGARSEAELLAQRIFVPHLRRIFREYANIWRHWVEPLVPIIPQTLYTHIRNLKRSGTKKLSSHDQKIRREMLVEVLKVLGRHKKARRLEREMGTGE